MLAFRVWNACISLLECLHFVRGMIVFCEETLIVAVRKWHQIGVFLIFYAQNGYENDGLIPQKGHKWFIFQAKLQKNVVVATLVATGNALCINGCCNMATK